MRALTVAPGIANSARVEDVPEPPASDGSVLVRALVLGVCGTDREIVSGDYGWAPARAEAAGDRARVPGRGSGGAGRFRLQTRRSCRRHRAPPRSGAVSVLRRRRMGYVPQRPLHRTRHQGTQRLRFGFLPDRAGISHQARSIARHERRPRSSRPALSPRRGTRPTVSGNGRARGRRRRCLSPAPARSVFWPR